MIEPRPVTYQELMCYNSLPSTYHYSPSTSQVALSHIVEDYGGIPISPYDFYQRLFPHDSIQSYERPTTPYTPSNLSNKEPWRAIGNPLLMIVLKAPYFKNERRLKPWQKRVISYREKQGKPCHVNDTLIHRETRILFNDYDLVKPTKKGGIRALNVLPHVSEVYCSPLTYIGKTRDLNHAITMRGMVFDLDFICCENMRSFFVDQAAGNYPMPNMIVLSGNGIHLYYLFEEPVILYHGHYGRKIKKQLTLLKKAMTRLLWNRYTIGQGQGNNVQYQGINQPFRVPGSFTKRLTGEGDRYLTIAYNFPNVPLYNGPDDFYKYVNIPNEDHYKAPSGHDLEFWKQTNPEWYERRIVKGDKSVKYWHMSKNLYTWFLRRVYQEAQYGHRYFCMAMLAVYAIKCDVPKEELEQDLRYLAPVLTQKHPDDPITEEDIEDALALYKESYNTFPVNSIQYLSGLDMRSNTRRNGRKQKDHLFLARSIQKVLMERYIETINSGLRGVGYPEKDPSEIKWQTYKNKNGRKPGTSKEKIKIMKWKQLNPNGTIKSCIAETGISRSTVFRWWKEV